MTDNHKYEVRMTYTCIVTASTPQEAADAAQRQAQQTDPAIEVDEIVAQ